MAANNWDLLSGRGIKTPLNGEFTKVKIQKSQVLIG
jgi:hypothetical protein